MTTSTSTSNRCPDCGADNLAGARFCSNCARRLRDETGADAPPRDPMRRSRHTLWLGFAIVFAAGIAVFLLTRPTPIDPTTSPLSADPKVAATEQRLAKVVAALDAWLKKHMSYPELAELLVRDDYLRPADFDDAWGRRVDYTRLDDLHYRLCSRGPDNLPKTDDDVCLGGRP